MCHRTGAIIRVCVQFHALLARPLELKQFLKMRTFSPLLFSLNGLCEDFGVEVGVRFGLEKAANLRLRGFYKSAALGA